MFVCLESETVIDIDEVLLLLADRYTACICWIPLHIIMMRNLPVRASVNSVIDSVLTFYSITSKIGPSLENCFSLHLLGPHSPRSLLTSVPCLLLLLLFLGGNPGRGATEWLEMMSDGNDVRVPP